MIGINIYYALSPEIDANSLLVGEKIALSYPRPLANK